MLTSLNWEQGELPINLVANPDQLVFATMINRFVYLLLRRKKVWETKPMGKEVEVWWFNSNHVHYTSITRLKPCVVLSPVTGDQLQNWPHVHLSLSLSHPPHTHPLWWKLHWPCEMQMLCSPIPPDVGGRSKPTALAKCRTATTLNSASKYETRRKK